MGERIERLIDKLAKVQAILTTSRRNAASPLQVPIHWSPLLTAQGGWVVAELTPPQAHKAEFAHSEDEALAPSPRDCSVFYLLHLSSSAQAFIPQDMHSAVAKMLIAHWSKFGSKPVNSFWHTRYYSVRRIACWQNLKGSLGSEEREKLVVSTWHQFRLFSL